MEFHWQDLAFWELVLDAVALLLCAMAVVGLVVWRRERVPALYSTGAVPGHFESLEKRGHPFQDGEPTGDPMSTARPDFRQAEPESADSGDVYDQARQLAEGGMSVSAVAEAVGRPRGEVELALKFRRMAPPEADVLGASVIPLRDSRPGKGGPDRQEEETV